SHPGLTVSSSVRCRRPGCTPEKTLLGVVGADGPWGQVWATVVRIRLTPARTGWASGGDGEGPVPGVAPAERGEVGQPRVVPLGLLLPGIVAGQRDRLRPGDELGCELDAS